jgi:type III pantothenate kinase
VTTVLDIFEKYDKSFCAQIIIASVIKSLAELAYKKLEELFPDKVRIAKFTPELPFVCKYKKPLTLGADRLANALYGYTAFSGKNLILISAGTAIVVDLLCANEFVGGAILPGVSTQLQSLKKATDALPAISMESQQTDFPIPGLTTEECISAGVFYGAVGAIERIVGEIKSVVASDCIVLGTGGDWELLSKHISFEFQSIPDMTLIGTALFVNYL